MPRGTTSWSLRRRLLTIGAVAATATLLASGTAMYYAADLDDQRLLDARLGAMAQTILAFAEHEIEEMNAQGQYTSVDVGTDASLGANYHYQIWSPNGRMLLRTMDAPLAPMRPLVERGFGTATLGNARFRTYTHASAVSGGMIIQVAEPVAARHPALGRVGGYFFAFMTLPLCLIFAAKWWFLNRSLRVVDGLANQLQKRHPLDLAPVRVENPPAELEPMLDSINGFISRAGHALSTERGFTAVAAHEMRTPLAGIRARAQMAMKAASPREASDSLRLLIESVDHASHLQTQLLDLARADVLASDQGPVSIHLVDLRDVYQAVLSDLGHVASERNLVLTERFEVFEVRAARLSIHLLMHNLLSNAIRYTPQGGQIEISSTGNGDTATLTVDDSGPGIPKNQREQAFERFNRLGRFDELGVGLGLSIVQSVALAHRTAVQLLESPLGGLRVQVRFKPQAA